MQWLIDLIIERIGVPPCYINRGDPPNVDYTIVDLTADGAWHTLDLSGIIPEGATAVNLQVFIANNQAQKTLLFRPDGNINTANNATVVTQVGFFGIPANCPIALSADRKIEYTFAVGGWLLADLTVCGWWL